MSDNASKIKSLMVSVLKIEEAEVESVAYSVHYSWDSLTHVILIAALEKEFNLKFNTEQITAMTSYQEISKVING